MIIFREDFTQQLVPFRLLSCPKVDFIVALYFFNLIIYLMIFLIIFLIIFLMIFLIVLLIIFLRVLLIISPNKFLIFFLAIFLMPYFLIFKFILFLFILFMAQVTSQHMVLGRLKFGALVLFLIHFILYFICFRAKYAIPHSLFFLPSGLEYFFILTQQA